MMRPIRLVYRWSTVYDYSVCQGMTRRFDGLFVRSVAQLDNINIRVPVMIIPAHGTKETSFRYITVINIDWLWPGGARWGYLRQFSWCVFAEREWGLTRQRRGCFYIIFAQLFSSS